MKLDIAPDLAPKPKHPDSSVRFRMECRRIPGIGETNQRSTVGSQKTVLPSDTQNIIGAATNYRTGNPEPVLEHDIHYAQSNTANIDNNPITGTERASTLSTLSTNLTAQNPNTYTSHFPFDEKILLPENPESQRKKGFERFKEDVLGLGLTAPLIEMNQDEISIKSPELEFEAGMSALVTDGQLPVIRFILVKSSLRLQKKGREMVSFWEEFMHNLGHRRVGVEDVSNLQFWTKLGYRYYPESGRDMLELWEKHLKI
jgi:hypothetical protein